MSISTIVLSALLVISITATVIIEIKRAKDRKLARALETERIAVHKEMTEKIVYFGQVVKNMKVDIVEFESMRRWIRELLDQLQKHSDMMDQVNAPFDPIVTINGELGPEELEDMIKTMQSTGFMPLGESEISHVARAHKIDTDIVEAFERRRDYYKRNPSYSNWKRAFIADFETIHKWDGVYRPLNNIHDFDTVIILVSGNYMPVIKFGA